ncbi:MAG: hypothetical protein E7231_05935 [Cellulosilyticum sp.]|nr:hypothetical protein [Cellulosilyticum sp.]
MELIKIQTLLNAQVWAGEENLESEVYSACGCDLMSDVLAFAKEKIVLLTGLINLQVIRTAEMLDIKAIVFVRGKQPTQDMIDLANERGIVLLSTLMPLYPACGILYEAGLQG